tara:strand:- start:837 stop:1160 length:324 start_codon:yes stop_codon:yes gene_type:complete
MEDPDDLFSVFGGGASSKPSPLDTPLPEESKKRKRPAKTSQTTNKSEVMEIARDADDSASSKRAKLESGIAEDAMTVAENTAKAQKTANDLAAGKEGGWYFSCLTQS